ncbi:hypothetical protein Pla8534_33850 [Lignipirellula cremea]|uniref:Uncharacterized protein n=2 Tax=Lignipirellula cremea TaxID=2528010 RepID=A0A518DUQ9_9BACT|nr:hypothetical protein Pla8534_33850 [Lignipirellula cremea]
MRFTASLLLGVCLLSGTVYAQGRGPELATPPAAEPLPMPSPSAPPLNGPVVQGPSVMAPPYLPQAPIAEAVVTSHYPAIPVSQRNIRYAHHPTLFKTRSPEHVPPLETVLLVEDPCQPGCMVAVPVCLPGCCLDEPITHSAVGLLGRGFVTYRYSCGYRLKLIFDRDGDVVVHSFGR